MRKWIAVAVLAVVGFVGLGGAAYAHTKTFSRSMTTSVAGNRVDGDIDASKTKCFAGVRVDIRNENGEGGVVDTEFTNLEGEFSFENLPTGVYKVSAPKYVFKKNAEHKHKCQALAQTEPGWLVA